MTGSYGFRELVSCFPSMPKKLAMTVGYFIAGDVLFAVGRHLSMSMLLLNKQELRLAMILSENG
ncbi:hypothetical protein CUMW_009640 [Citrus unshiu]|nr:hypothetical protein CUMW_009640 [Citrus unshiu]